MPTNKNQHFVPQHYLRLFSTDAGKNIAIARIEPFKFAVGSISGQCQEDWFYRDDGELDEWLKVTEGAYAELLPQILATKKLSDSQRVACHFMVVLFYIRTRKAAEIHGLFSRRMFFDVVNDGIKKGKVPPAPPDWSMETVAASGVSGFLVNHVLIQCFLEMATLQCKLLEARESKKFITSDHPSVCMNQLLADEAERTGRSYTGFSRSGFQLVLPISPTLCLFFYDPKIYKVGSRRSNPVILNDEDVELINSLQVQNADKCIYTADSSSNQDMDALVSKYKSLRKQTSDGLSISFLADKTELYHFKSPNPLLLRPWAFCKVRKNARINESKRRNPDWTEVVSAFAAHANKTRPEDVMKEFAQFVESYGR